MVTTIVLQEAPELDFFYNVPCLFIPLIIFTRSMFTIVTCIRIVCVFVK